MKSSKNRKGVVEELESGQLLLETSIPIENAVKDFATAAEATGLVRRDSEKW